MPVGVIVACPANIEICNSKKAKELKLPSTRGILMLGQRFLISYQPSFGVVANLERPPERSLALV